MNSSFQPINNANAIAETIFYFSFSLNIKIDQIIAVNKVLRDTYEIFNKDNPIYKMEPEPNFNHNDSSSETIDVSRKITGFELESLKDDGQVSWGITLSTDGLLIHCLEYSTWSEVWSEALGYINTIFNILSFDNSLLITNIGLKYLDIFRNKNLDQNFCISELFSEGNPFLTKKSMYSGSAWHCNSGWFDELPAEINIKNFSSLKCLNQLKVESNFILDEETNERAYSEVSIDHGSFLIPSALSASKSTIGIEIGKLGESYFGEYFEFLHQNNKNILSELLTQKTCKRISLN